MNAIKKILGVAWIVMAPVLLFVLIKAALHNISISGAEDGNGMIWIIIIAVFIPVLIGMMVFVWNVRNGKILCGLLASLLLFIIRKAYLLNVSTTGKGDINKPLPWIIIIIIFIPIAIGFMIFGWYALKGEYDRLPESSKDL